MNRGTDGSQARILILGLGNVLLGDDGLGPAIVELFHCRYECGTEVEILDLGAPGSDITPYLYGRHLVIIADALKAEHAPGTLCFYRRNDAAVPNVGVRVTGHDPGLVEALAQLELMGQAPSELVVIGAVPESCRLNERMSSTVLRVSSALVDHIAGLLLEHDVPCVLRTAPLRPNLWWLSQQDCEFLSAVRVQEGATGREALYGLRTVSA